MLSCPCLQVWVFTLSGLHISAPLPQPAWLYLTPIVVANTLTYMCTHAHHLAHGAEVQKCRSEGASAAGNKLKHCEWWVCLCVCSAFAALQEQTTESVCVFVYNVLKLSQSEFILNLALIRLTPQGWSHAYMCMPLTHTHARTHAQSVTLCVCVCAVGGSRMVLPTWGRAGEEEAS